MKSALKTLTRIQKFQIDEQRKILSELQEKQDILQAQLEQLNRDFEREKEFIAKSYHVKPEDLEIYCLKHIQVAKISLPRVPVEGSRDERDMHGGQQYVSLLDIEC